MTGSDLAARLAAGFAAFHGGAPAIVARAPGRVNLIGEHTDYNDGFALPVAIGAETRVALSVEAGASLRVAALDLGEHDTFDPATVAPVAHGGWRNYVRGVVDELVRAGVPVTGGAIALAGSIVRGTGLSSSASLSVALAHALLAAAGQSWDPVAIALLAQRAECGFPGVRCGNLDQIASAASRSGHALMIDCRTLALAAVPVPDDCAVMIVQSGVRRGLVDGEYNARRAQCEAAAAALGVAALRDADMALLDAAAPRLDRLTQARARHVIGENARVLAAAQALAADDLVACGRLMRESHASQAHDFGITVPQTDRLAELLNALIGAEGGARQTGGGFGGAVVAVLRADRVAAVASRVREAYRTPDGTAPVITIERPAAGAGLIAR